MEGKEMRREERAKNSGDLRTKRQKKCERCRKKMQNRRFGNSPMGENRAKYCKSGKKEKGAIDQFSLSTRSGFGYLAYSAT